MAKVLVTEDQKAQLMDNLAGVKAALGMKSRGFKLSRCFQLMAEDEENGTCKASAYIANPEGNGDGNHD